MVGRATLLLLGIIGGGVVQGRLSSCFLGVQVSGQRHTAALCGPLTISQDCGKVDGAARQLLVSMEGCAGLPGSLSGL